MKDPIFYNNLEEMQKPLSELMEQLRCDIARIRGKLGDIKRQYGWKDRIEDLEGGLTCMIVAMSHVQKQWKAFEEEQPKEAKLVEEAFACYELCRPNIPDAGCTKQCNQCAEKYKQISLSNNHTEN